jgi:hypothetical protein
MPAERRRVQYHAAMADPITVARIPMFRLFKVPSCLAPFRNFGASDPGV